MRVSTKAKPYIALDNARRYGSGSDFDASVKIESKINSEGLLVFGPFKDDEVRCAPTEIDIAWGDTDSFLRMKYIVEGGAKGLLLSAFDETHLPEKKLIANDGIDGFVFTADRNGSSYLFGKFSEERGSLDIFEESWIPGLKTLHATRMTNLHMNRLIGNIIETFIEKL